MTLKTTRVSGDGKYIFTTYHVGTPGMEIYGDALRREMMDVANDEHLKTMADEPPKLGLASGKLIDPPKEDEVLVTYPDTLDGFLAAWVVRKIAQEKHLALEVVHYPSADIDLTGRNWIIIGNSMHPDEISSKPKSGLYIQIDRGDNAVDPIPFKDWKRTFPFGIETMVKKDTWAGVQGTSLCKTAWEFFHADANVAKAKLPRLLDYVNDSMTEKRYGDTAEIMGCLESYHRNFQTYDRLIEACDDHKRRAYMIAAGQAVIRYKELNPI